MTAADTIKDAVAGAGALGRSAPDEPVFVLVARDALAAETVRAWADLLEARSAGFGRLDLARKAKIAEARECARLMDAWPTHKLPD